MAGNGKEYNIKIPGPCPARAPKKEEKKNKLPECPPWGCPPPICPMFPFPSYGCLPFPRPPLETFNCPMCNPNPIFSNDKKGSSSSNNSSGGAGGCGCGGGNTSSQPDPTPRSAGNSALQPTNKAILTPCSSTSAEPPTASTANSTQQTLAGTVPQNMASSYNNAIPQQQQQQLPNVNLYNNAIPQQQQMQNMAPYNNYAPQNMMTPYSFNSALPQTAAMNSYSPASMGMSPQVNTYNTTAPQAVSYKTHIPRSIVKMTQAAYLPTPPESMAATSPLPPTPVNVNNNVNITDTAEEVNNTLMVKAPELTSDPPNPRQTMCGRTNCGGLPCNLPCGPLPGPVLPPKPQGCRCKMPCGAPCPPCPPASRPPTLTPKCQYPDNPCNGIREPCPPAAGVPPGCQRDENCQSIVCPE